MHKSWILALLRLGGSQQGKEAPVGGRGSGNTREIYEKYPDSRRRDSSPKSEPKPEEEKKEKRKRSRA